MGNIINKLKNTIKMGNKINKLKPPLFQLLSQLLKLMTQTYQKCFFFF